MECINEWKLKHKRKFSYFNIVGGVSGGEKKSCAPIIKFFCDFILLRWGKTSMKTKKKATKPFFASCRRWCWARKTKKKKKLWKRCSVFPFSFKSMCCMIYERYNCFQKHYIFIKNGMNEYVFVAKSHSDEGTAFTQIAFTSSPSFNKMYVLENHSLRWERRKKRKYNVCHMRLTRIFCVWIIRN